MFTGLVEAQGTLTARTPRGPGARLAIRCGLSPLVLGESIAVDGVCLTVDEITAGGFLADASAETLERTTLGALRVGHAANLERAMPLGGRMGGHIVTGHVDGTVALYARKPLGDAVQLVFEFPREWARLIAVKGSICINGVSLTVNGIEGGRFDVVVVPHTREATSLDRLVVGHRVNIEVDVLARYVARMIDAASEGGVSAKEHEARDATLLGHLKKSGYV